MKVKMFVRTNNKWGFFSNWFYGVTLLGSGLVQTLSLGFYCTNWTLDFARWRTWRGPFRRPRQAEAGDGEEYGIKQGGQQ